ncbi:hypothetical protein PN498_11090 [Oscillatoria sp. CS-180]|uniref:hypothetical protein n=1 Tax=Oscillatoria sp. CS-180 TaxID=3021720 RepID=UPI002330B0D3|nr:hypothetical protein [Oscillatoria sp. CS-180]MDB9526536.1 hypothetical protein [Oscillatoria sp. CS-180]
MGSLSFSKAACLKNRAPNLTQSSCQQSVNYSFGSFNNSYFNNHESSETNSFSTQKILSSASDFGHDPLPTQINPTFYSNAPIQAKSKDEEGVSDWIHTGLDAAGFIPVIGAAFDIANAGLYAAEGDWGNVALSTVSSVPGIGDAIGGTAKAVKLTSKAIPKAGKMVSMGSKTIKHSSRLAGKKLNKKAEKIQGISEKINQPIYSSLLKGPATPVGELLANKLVKGEGAKNYLKRQAIKQGTIQGIKHGAGYAFGEDAKMIAGGVKGETDRRKLERMKASHNIQNLAETASGAWDWSKDTALDTADMASKGASDAWDWTRDTVLDTADTVSTGGSDAWDWTKDTASNAVDTASKGGSDAWDWTRDTALNTADTVSRGASDAWDWTEDTTSDATNAVSDTWKRFKDWW